MFLYALPSVSGTGHLRVTQKENWQPAHRRNSLIFLLSSGYHWILESVHSKRLHPPPQQTWKLLLEDHRVQLLSRFCTLLPPFVIIGYCWKSNVVEELADTRLPCQQLILEYNHICQLIIFCNGTSTSVFFSFPCEILSCSLLKPVEFLSGEKATCDDLHLASFGALAY